MSRNMERASRNAPLRTCGRGCTTYFPNIDAIDRRSDVKSGLGFVALAAVLIVFFSVIFALTGIPWVRSWEGQGVCVQGLRDVLVDAGISPQTTCVDYAFRGLNYKAIKENSDLSQSIVRAVKTAWSRHMNADVDVDRVQVRLMEGRGSTAAAAEVIARCVLVGGRLQTPNEVASARQEIEETLASETRAACENATTSAITGEIAVKANSPVLTADPQDATKAFDVNADGVISPAEFKSVMRRTAYGDVTQRRVVWDGLDLNSDGLVMSEELEDALAAASGPSECWPTLEETPLAMMVQQAPEVPTPASTTAAPSTTGETETPAGPADAASTGAPTTTTAPPTTTTLLEVDFPPAELKRALAGAGVLPRIGAVNYTVKGLSYWTLLDDAKIYNIVKVFASNTVSDSLSGDASPQQIQVELAEGKYGGGTSTDILCTMPVTHPSKLQQLSGLSTEIHHMLEDDISARCQAASLTGETARSPAVGTIVVEGGNASSVVNESAYGNAFDGNGDGDITWEEFQNVTRGLDGVDDEEARYAFARLDADGDRVVRPGEVQAALGGGAWPSPTTTTQTTTVQITATETTTAAPTEAPNVVLVRMDVQSLKWEGLEDTRKRQMADAFREKLAFLMGNIHSDDVMDVLGKPGCISVSKALSPEPATQRLRRLQPAGGNLALSACVSMPLEATMDAVEKLSPILQAETLADFEHKAGVQVAAWDAVFSFDGRDSCNAPGFISRDAEKHSFCEVEPTQPPTTAAATTTAAGATTGASGQPLDQLAQPTTTQASSPPSDGQLPSMADFMGRLGTDLPCESAFSTIDPDGNRVSYLSELAVAAATFDPPYRETQIANLFDWLDNNKDGRIEAIEFAEPCQRMRAEQAAAVTANAAGAIPMSLYRKSLGQPTEFRKLGVGLCRTAEEAWPHSAEHPEAKTKDLCQKVCQSSESCGAFALRPGGACRTYPSGSEYTDTTSSLDVECFAKVYSTRARFDMATVQWDFQDIDLSGITSAQLSSISQQLASAVASEMSMDPRGVRDRAGTPETCSLTPGAQHGKTSSQAMCLISSPNVGDRIEALRAAFRLDATRQRLADLMAPSPGLSSLSAGNLQLDIAGSSALFRAADANGDGIVVLDEFLRSAATRPFPLLEDSAKFAFQQLDRAKDGALSPNEFEADGLTRWAAAPLRS